MQRLALLWASYRITEVGGDLLRSSSPSSFWTSPQMQSARCLRAIYSNVGLCREEENSDFVSSACLTSGLLSSFRTYIDPGKTVWTELYMPWLHGFSIMNKSTLVEELNKEKLFKFRFKRVSDCSTVKISLIPALDIEQWITMSFDTYFFFIFQKQHEKEIQNIISHWEATFKPLWEF